jgi:hypothetical protein
MYINSTHACLLLHQRLNDVSYLMGYKMPASRGENIHFGFQYLNAHTLFEVSPLRDKAGHSPNNANEQFQLLSFSDSASQDSRYYFREHCAILPV